QSSRARSPASSRCSSASTARSGTASTPPPKKPRTVLRTLPQRGTRSRWSTRAPSESAGSRPWRALPERAVEVHGRADQRQVRERLREVAERLAGAADLLGV